MQIVLSPAVVINFNIDDSIIISLNDNFKDLTISANINNIPRPVLLWSGEEEYNSAGAWTNELAFERFLELANSNRLSIC